ncbi:hypothetical protein LXE94_12445 [Bacillus subtilis]|uniref:hypothetical protein n=1 Tax=Bacillus subtilis TaxID=1423 RepID=UPI002155C66E|nr:hypothetical protein [Bacillus subtilis]UVB74038.1 hypothetical protein LXE94_12445 [Bacillus subtilis]
MTEHQIRSLSILENDQMTGIVALGDLSVEKDTVKKRKQHNENGPQAGMVTMSAFLLLGKL